MVFSPLDYNSAVQEFQILKVNLRPQEQEIHNLSPKGHSWQWQEKLLVAGINSTIAHPFLCPEKKKKN